MTLAAVGFVLIAISALGMILRDWMQFTSGWIQVLAGLGVAGCLAVAINIVLLSF